MATLVRDIEGVREFLKVDKWYVLGHSWGGMLGLEYVSAHPEHVLGYVHMDGLVSVPATQDALLDNAEAAFKADAACEEAGPKKERADGLLKTVRHLRALPPSDPKRFTGALGLAMGPAGLYFAKDQETAWAGFNVKTTAATKPYGIPLPALLPAWEPFAALIQNEHYLTRDDRPLIARITVPTLVINGAEDGLITPQGAESVQRGIPGAKLVLLDDCGHFPFAEQPDKTADAVRGFVNRK
jgi:pimeloyl-ACP methyl ester carboxylesterase